FVGDVVVAYFLRTTADRDFSHDATAVPNCIDIVAAGCLRLFVPTELLTYFVGMLLRYFTAHEITYLVSTLLRTSHCRAGNGPRSFSGTDCKKSKVETRDSFRLASASAAVSPHALTFASVNVAVKSSPSPSIVAGMFSLICRGSCASVVSGTTYVLCAANRSKVVVSPSI